VCPKHICQGLESENSPKIRTLVGMDKILGLELSFNVFQKLVGISLSYKNKQS
jgi:hypothetical protein